VGAKLTGAEFARSASVLILVAVMGAVSGCAHGLGWVGKPYRVTERNIHEALSPYGHWHVTSLRVRAAVAAGEEIYSVEASLSPPHSGDRSRAAVLGKADEKCGTLGKTVEIIDVDSWQKAEHGPLAGISSGWAGVMFKCK
jgi:hypothetical protein